MSNSITELASKALQSGADGAVNDLNVKSNITYEQAKVPEAEGMTLRIGTNGVTELYKDVNASSDVVQSSTNSTADLAILETPIEIHSITLTSDISSADSSFLFWGAFGALTSSKDLTITIKVDGTVIGTETFTLWSGDGQDYQPITISSLVGASYAINQIITVEATAEKNDRIIMNTNSSSSSFKITTSVPNVLVTTLDGLDNVAISSPTLADILTYDDTTSKWKNAPSGSFLLKDGSVKMDVGYVADTPESIMDLNNVSDFVALESKNYVTKENFEKTIINNYEGDITPPNTLGKDGDFYTKIATGTTLFTIFDQTSNSAYVANDYFTIYSNPSATLEEVVFVDIDTTDGSREVEMGFNGSTPDFTDITLSVEGNDVPLTLLQSTQLNRRYTYPSASDGVISAITTTTLVKMTYKQSTGAVSSNERFVKDLGRWLHWEQFSKSTIDLAPSGATPTRGELATAVEDVATGILNWDFAEEHIFFVNDTTNSTLWNVKYYPKGDTDISGTLYEFWLEAMTKAL